MVADPLADLERRLRTGLAGRLTRPPPREGGEIAPSGLGVVLFDVLAEGFKPGTESAKQLDDAWTRVEGGDAAIPRRTFDYEGFMLGAFATTVGISIALNTEEAERVRHAFVREAGALPNRLRRQTPGPRRFRRYLAYYGDAVGAEVHPSRTSYVPVALAFTDACRTQSLDAEAFAAAEPSLAVTGIDLFFHAVAGTVEAVRGWQIT